jgi:hypothetical protein
VPVWGAGLWFAFTRRGEDSRPFAVLFLVMFAALLVMGGKPYYLAGAYPAVLAAGGVALERWLDDRTRLFRSFVGGLAVTGVTLALLSLPLLPIRTVDRVLGSALGAVVPPMALTHDMHGELGWSAHVDTVERVLDSLPTEDRAHAVVLTGTYSQAGALNVLRDEPTPRAVSGHMTYHLWGEDELASAEVVIAYGVPRSLLERHYASVEELDRVVAPDARPGDADLPVFVCRRPSGVGSTRALWSQLRRFHHGSLPESHARPGERRRSR